MCSATNKNILIILAFVIIFSGCTSISAIEGLSAQNLRNAYAINTNISTLILVSDMSIKYTVNSLWVDANRKIILELAKNRRQYITQAGNGDSTKIKKDAKKLREVANAKPEETRKSFIQKSRMNNPLIAAVAFDEGINANIASALAVEINQIYEHTELDDQDRFFRAMSAISNFKIIQENKEARDDVSEAYHFLRNTIKDQSAIYIEAAEQFDSASRAGSSAPDLIRGITENQTVIETIATVVLNRTNDESRANAARDLLSGAEED
jgi:hypothetical protein